ncbi:MAG TPA: HAD family hydrolase [Candidatus Limnocylindrales bacterium]|nr:HAD family hydrolase [Candidatus Limnocylindrales bacterium]
MPTVRALSFDLDGTLLDGSPWRAVIIRSCEEIAAALPGLDANRLVEANAEVWERYFPEVERSWALGMVDGRSVTAEAWRRTLVASGSDDPAIAEFATATYLRNRRDALRLFDDARDILDRIGTSLPVAVITNGASDTQREALRILGIEHRFRVIVISGEVGMVKPDPGIFEIAINRLGVERQAFWHVGDNPHVDVEGARRARITAIWLNRSGATREPGDPTPDFEIASLTELSGLSGRVA